MFQIYLLVSCNLGLIFIAGILPGEISSAAKMNGDFRRPCDFICNAGTATPIGCNATCTVDSKIEVLPANAHCRPAAAGPRGSSSLLGDVVCDQCYVSLGRRCVREAANDVMTLRGRGEQCSTDCQCDTDARLRCVRVCGCPDATYRHDGRSCVKREFGDACSTDSDCQVYGASSEGFTYTGGICVDNRCQCDAGSGYFETKTSFINATTGLLFTKSICVIDGTTVNIAPGKVCSLDPISDSDSSQTRVCAPGSTCFACPEEEVSSAASDEGKCRSLMSNLQTVKNQQCPPSAFNRTSNLDRFTSKVGKLCFRDNECGRNEVCEMAPVKPACLAGFCSCLPCYAIGSNGTCAPTLKVAFGDRCSGTANEVLPANAMCLSGIVACLSPMELDRNGRCGFRQTGKAKFGEQCELTDPDACIGELVCSNSPGHAGNCNCQSNDTWNQSEQRCKPPMPPPPTCEEISDCSALAAKDREEMSPEMCKADADGSKSTTTTPGPTSTKGISTQPAPIATAIATTSTPLAISTPATKEPMIKNSTEIVKGTCNGPPESKLGSACQSDEECGACEVCVIQRGEPSCLRGICTCRSGFGRGVSGKCEPLRYLNLGNHCSGDQAENERLPAYAICKKSRVHCNIFTQRIVDECRRRSVPGVYGSRCLTSLDCLGSNNELWCDRDLQRCVCYDPSHRFNEHTGRCESREYGDACTRHKDCRIFGSVSGGGYTYGGGRCNVDFHRCECAANFVSATFGFIVPARSNAFKTKKICVHKSSTLNVPVGGVCTLDPIFYGNNPLGRVRICQSGAFCSRCPGEQGDGNGDSDDPSSSQWPPSSSALALSSHLPSMTIYDGICRRA